MERRIDILIPAFVVNRLASGFHDAAPDVELNTISFESDGTCHNDPAQAMALFRYFPNDRFSGKPFGTAELKGIMQRAPRLSWVQTNASGVDGLLFPELVDSDIVLTSGASVNEGPVAESVLALMLAVAKRIPQHVRHQVRHEWQRYQKSELRGSTVTVVGYGHIGEQVGQLCQGFGMRVVAVRRRPEQRTPFAETVFGPDRLMEALSQADFVVLVAAHTGGREALLGADEFDAMKPTAWLINVGRGSLVDQAALLAALNQDALAGAALDVFDHEPLREDSPLWEYPNVLVTPHNSASSPHQDQRTLDLFVENFRRWVAGEELLNVVNKRRGY